MAKRWSLPTRPEPKPTILIVEDHADTRDAMGLLLADLGYRVLLATCGSDALTILKARRPDLILCDVRMPGMDGFDFVKAVRALPGVAGVRVVAVTGVTDRAVVARLLQAGFDAHLTKPIDYDVLDGTLRRLLGAPAHDAEPICPRCSKGITPGTASKLAGRPVHVRCLARATQLKSIELHDTARQVQDRARRLTDHAAALVAEARAFPRGCPICGNPLSLGGSLLLQGNDVVHATCRRGVTPPDTPSPAA
jgi:CheY-like chemotaxis protein